MRTEIIWQKIRSGDRHAFEQLYHLEVDELLRYGYRFTDDYQLVEDCTQDLFVEIWNKRKQLKAVKSVRSYLLVSLRRKIIRQLNRHIKKIASEEITENDLDVSLSIDEAIISREIASEKLEQLKQAIRQLSNRQKEVLYLKYQQGLEYDEICEVMDLNYQSARNLIASAIKKMKGILYWLLLFLAFLSTN